jgi:xanthine dehydrogenase large subunit
MNALPGPTQLNIDIKHHSVAVAVQHESAHLHVAGEAIYTDDIAAPRETLSAAIGYAPVAHAKLKSVDLSAVRRASGVVAVFTAGDVPGVNNYGGIVLDDPILVTDLIEYHGQPVFMVVAESHQLARKAVRLARYDFEIRTPILTIDDALAAKSYVLPPVTTGRGDAEAALARSPRRLQGKTVHGGQDHFYLEGMVSMAHPAEDGQISIQCSTQHPSEIQHIVARAMALPDAKVRVECRRMGGGFGGKESQPALFASLCAIAASKLGRSVKMRLDRDDDMIITGKRHPFQFEYDVGFDDDGLVLGIDLLLASDCGYSADLSGPVNARAICHVDNAYFLEHVRIRNFPCKTNKVSNTAFRGFGGPQGMFVIEQVMDEIAHALDKDPLDVRKANFYGLGERNETHYGQPLEDNILHDIVPDLERRADYRARRSALRHLNKSSLVIKRGLALTPVKFGISFNATHLNQAGALINIYSDGSVIVNHGGTEMGQGLFTKVAQVVAEELGIDPRRICVSTTDTSKVPNTSATAASSGSDLNGMAAKDACRKLRDRLAEFAGHKWDVSPSEIHFVNDGIEADVSGGRERWSFDDLAHRAYVARVSLSAQGFYKTPKIHWNRDTFKGRPFYYFAYGAACAQVAVDTLTGEIKVERVDILHDVGRSLNPAIDKGQIEGAFIQGVGWLTAEELVWNDGGALATHAPSTYKIPTAADIPEVFNVWLVENSPNNEDTIYRSKAVGEPPFMLAFAVFQAIRDAVSSVTDYRDSAKLAAPATPETILRAISAAMTARVSGG